MAGHPRPQIIADTVTHVAQLLRQQPTHQARSTSCGCLECAARLLAERGWPASGSTAGDGRGGGDSSSTESAALLDPLFRDLDVQVHAALRQFWADARAVEDLIHKVRSHDNDSEQTAALGNCTACERFCNPRKKQSDRLVSGLCPACYQAWRRWTRDNPGGLRPDFIRARRAQLNEAA